VQSAQPYNLHVVASPLALTLLPWDELARLNSDHNKRNRRVEVSISLHLIQGGGILARPRPETLEGLKHQPRDAAKPEELLLSETELDRVTREMNDRLASNSKVDHLIFAKEGWAVSPKAAEDLRTVHDSRRDMTRWITVLSGPTAAHGNAVLRAYIERYGLGRFHESTGTPQRSRQSGERSGTSSFDALEFWQRMVGEAAGRAARNKPSEPETRTIDIVASDISEGSGHVIPKDIIERVRINLERIAAALSGERGDAGATSVGVMLESIQHFRVAKTAPRVFGRSINDLSKSDKEELLNRVSASLSALRDADAAHCTAFYMEDQLLFGSQHN
jgi:hypothetical protein